MKANVFRISRLKKSRVTIQQRFEVALKHIHFLLRSKDENVLELFTKFQATAFIRSTKLTKDKKAALAKQIMNLMEMVASDRELDHIEFESAAVNKIVSDQGILNIISFAIDEVMKKHAKQFI